MEDGWVEKMVKRLENDGYPPESIEDFRKFRSRGSLLYHLVERDLENPTKKVSTPKGEAVLLKVEAGRAFVVLDDATEKPFTHKRRRYPAMELFSVKEVRPA